MYRTLVFTAVMCFVFWSLLKIFFFYFVFLSVYCMKFHNFCSLRNAMCWKWVCLEHWKGKNQASNKI